MLADRAALIYDNYSGPARRYGASIDDAGHLWVRLVTHDDAVVFDVFDPEGRYLGAVDAGREMTAITPVIRGDRFYAVVADSLDIPYVVRYRIVGRTLLE